MMKDLSSSSHARFRSLDNVREGSTWEIFMSQCIWQKTLIVRTIWLHVLPGPIHGVINNSVNQIENLPTEYREDSKKGFSFGMAPPSCLSSAQVKQQQGERYQLVPSRTQVTKVQVPGTSFEKSAGTAKWNSRAAAAVPRERNAATQNISSSISVLRKDVATVG